MIASRILSGRLMPGRRPSALVFEADLDLDAVLDDLAVLDLGGRLHDLHGLDIPDRLRGGLDGSTSRVTPGVRAPPAHLANDDDAHAIDFLLRLGRGSLVLESKRPTRLGRPPIPR